VNYSCDYCAVAVSFTSGDRSGISNPWNVFYVCHAKAKDLEASPPVNHLVKGQRIMQAIMWRRCYVS